jgi:hypothetical protein
MKVGVATLTVLAAVGLAGCGGSHAIKPLRLRDAPPVFKDLLHPHKFAIAEVKAAFAGQGIRLRTLRDPYDARAVVLFDSRWRAPVVSQLEGLGHAYIWVLVHASAADIASGGSSLGNVFVVNGPDEEESVNAVFDTLYRSYKH